MSHAVAPTGVVRRLFPRGRAVLARKDAQRRRALGVRGSRRPRFDVRARPRRAVRRVRLDVMARPAGPSAALRDPISAVPAAGARRRPSGGEP